jgi:sugar phosphate isomerase/epimerase
MEFCIFTWFGFRHPFEDIINLIKEAGFHSVMTWWEDIDGSKERQPGIIKKAGLKLENTHFNFKNVNSIWENTIDGEEIFNTYYSNIGDCRIYEIPTAVMHVTAGETPPPYNQLGLDRFKRLIEKAEKDNINIALENVRNPEYLDYIFESIKSDRLKFCYDSGHENCFTPNMDFLSKYGDRLIALHLHDNDGFCDQHLFPFKGSVNWRYIMEKLKRLEYKGPLAFELDTQYFDVLKEYTPREYLSEAIKRAKMLEEIYANIMI